MNASQFQEILKKADTLEKSDILQLKKVQENFPYFQIPHVLIAKYEFQKKTNLAASSLGWAAITSPDRIWLKKLVEQEVSNSATSPAEDLLPEDQPEKPSQASRTQSLKVLGEQLKGNKTEEPEKKVEEKPEPPKPKRRTRRASAGDDLIETIKKREKKTIVDSKKKEQIDLIKAFSKKSIKLATIKEIEANQNTENLAANSTQINDNLISESYAKLLLKQNKKDKAIEIYEKLGLKFPDKKTYFADLIENLKNS
ncbi:hypothetical protein [Algoriphagus zhangzhouensis]|uniref:Tetratricopeptide repeat-containing protein n=1 Tax=Algoriphagus zhangzhouensis TaxID=1073327 RepID=A0A1M7ZCP5_9BACT|nr:hypothetical protein [Algoriphagus zhangzhouensis]TDY45644.1 hypothetical protein A8938_2244 [Algoriphagus zhangzhouensis]SHO62685.1 hypothetical protein SAMN04488108_2242 [Algoriphagus zhangzhouensis]